MKRLRRFSRLSGIERRLLLKAALLLVVVRLGLWVLPFETLRRLLIRFSDGPIRLRDTDRSSVGDVTWAVKKAGRFMPRAATCLTLALTAQVLLLRRGHGAVVHIGVAKGDEKEFLAHAWVESEGRIVIGDHELDRYTPLTRLGDDGARRPPVRSTGSVRRGSMTSSYDANRGSVGLANLAPDVAPEPVRERRPLTGPRGDQNGPSSAEQTSGNLEESGTCGRP